MTRYISLTDTANMIRADLKAAYPDVKFSVRTRRFANGTAADITWVDGPTTIQVGHLVGKYEASTFDAMIDLSSPRYATDENGEQIMYGTKYVQWRREYSTEFLQTMVDWATNRWYWTEPPQYEIIPADPPYHPHVRTNNKKAMCGGQWADNWFHHLCWNTSAADLEQIKQELIDA